MIEFIEPVTVKLLHFQTRVEKHGDADVTAVDLTVERTAGNLELEMLIPGLRDALFTAIERQPEPGQGEMQLPVDELHCVRFPKLQCPIKIDHEQEGMRLVVDFGLGGDSDIVIALTKLHKVQLSQAIEGGSAKYKFTLSSSCDIDADITGPLSMLQQQDITISLISPTVEEEKPLTVGDVFGDQPPDMPKLTAEDVFVNESKPAPARKGKRIAA